MMMLTRERAVSPAAGQLGRGGGEVQLSAEPGRCALAQWRPLHLTAMQSHHLFPKWIFCFKMRATRVREELYFKKAGIKTL
jgi:hypothetical protein